MVQKYSKALVNCFNNVGTWECFLGKSSFVFFDLLINSISTFIRSSIGSKKSAGYWHHQLLGHASVAGPDQRRRITDQTLHSRAEGQEIRLLHEGGHGQCPHHQMCGRATTTGERVLLQGDRYQWGGNQSSCWNVRTSQTGQRTRYVGKEKNQVRWEWKWKKNK